MTWRVKAPVSAVPINPDAPPVIAVSALMKGIVAQAQRLSSYDDPVLIQGETGTGKEMLARTVHAGRGPFVVIDCTHLTPSLAESELFGHVRGAFTSADSERSGLMEAAHGGTAFFDEIGELPIEVQAKLLRLLQQKTYRRVGSVREQHSDFRVIAATHRDLKRDAHAGRFRQDLYFRLNVAQLKIPALRERKEDIPFLVQHFLRSTGLEAPPEVTATLSRYDWPGNVRQLENCIRRMVAQSYGGWLSPSQIPATVCLETAEQRPLLTMASHLPNTEEERIHVPSPTAAPPPKTAVPFRAEPSAWPDVPLVPLQTLEYLGILRALRETRGDRSQAADLLKIGRTTLYRKLLDMQKHPQWEAAIRQATGEMA